MDMELGRIHLYRMTHIENIPHILKYGITHRTSPDANPAYRVIGDASLISNRETKKILVSETLNPEKETITLGDYIPFYFGIRMPMLYVIQHGGNFVPRQTPPTEIVYLVCHLLSVAAQQSRCYYSNGHATEAITLFFDKTKIEELPTHINEEAVKSKYWGGKENLMLKWQKQAEFLAEDDVSPDLIKAFLCYDEAAKERLMGMGVEKNKIKVYPQAYY